MKKYHLIVLSSLLFINLALTSCGNKAVWSIAEPILILKPKADQKHISKTKNANFYTSIKTSKNEALSFSQFKYFLNYKTNKFENLNLNLGSQLHFQEQDLDATLKVKTICSLATRHSLQTTNIEHLTQMKIQKKLSFISFLPREILNITSEQLIQNTLYCSFSFTAISKAGDTHSFTLNKTMAEMANPDGNVHTADFNFSLFSLDYRAVSKEIKLKKTKNAIYIKEKNLDKYYVKDFNTATVIALDCKNPELNQEIKFSSMDSKEKQIFLSDFNDIANIHRRDILKNTSCRVIQYDQFNNIIKLSTVFTIQLENITQSPKPKKKFNPLKHCPQGMTDYGNGHCAPY